MITLCTCRADDLIPEESDTVLLALKRLPPKEAYDRVFRLRRAFQVGSSGDPWHLMSTRAHTIQCSLSHQLLPKDQHTKREEVGCRLITGHNTHTYRTYRMSHTYLVSLRRSKQNPGNVVTWSPWSSPKSRQISQQKGLRIIDRITISPICSNRRSMHALWQMYFYDGPRSFK